jgi:hypothetical protein
MFASYEILLDALLAYSLKERFVFLFGSGLTRPDGPGRPGVPDAEAIVQIVRSSLNSRQRRDLDRELVSPPHNRYQTAMSYLERVQGRSATQRIIAGAVLNAFTLTDTPDAVNRLGRVPTLEEIYALTEDALDSWILSPAVEAFGHLVMVCGRIFGADILTTNFDPLIEISIRRAGGHCFRVALAEDGNLRGIRGSVPRVVHLHGFYHGTDMLHTSEHLTSPRPKLEESLEILLAECTLVVVGYGGWDDVFMRALARAAKQRRSKRVYWAFHEDDDRSILDTHGHVIGPLMASVAWFFKGVDVNTLLPELYTQCCQREFVTRKGLEVYLREATGVVNAETAKWIEIIEGQWTDWRTKIQKEFDISSADVCAALSQFPQWSAEERERALVSFIALILHDRLGPWVIDASASHPQI